MDFLGPIRVAAVYGITGVEANTDYSVLHTGNTEFSFFSFVSVIKNKFSKKEYYDYN